MDGYWEGLEETGWSKDHSHTGIEAVSNAQ